MITEQLSNVCRYIGLIEKRYSKICQKENGNYLVVETNDAGFAIGKWEEFTSCYDAESRAIAIALNR